MDKKDSFIVYADWMSDLAEMTPEEYRFCVDAWFRMSVDGTMPDLASISDRFIRSFLLRTGEVILANRGKYIDRCRQNSRNAKQVKEQESASMQEEEEEEEGEKEPLQGTASDCEPSPAIAGDCGKSPCDNDNDNDNDIISPPIYIPPQPDPGKPLWKELQEKVGDLFRRRPATSWTAKELKALKEIAKRPGVLEEFGEIDILYRSGYEYRRRDILTFLNNWSLELDRARSRKGPERRLGL